MAYVLYGIVWIGVYLALVLTPILILLIRPEPGGNGLWWDFSLALGFAATTMMGVTFALTARFRYATDPFGIDIVYYVHRRLSVIALIFALAHPVIILTAEPSFLLLHPGRMELHMMAGAASLICLLVLIVSSIWRKSFRIEYDRWRFIHIILSVAALSLAVVHIQLVGYYVDAPWKKVLWLVIPASWVFFLLYRRLIKPWLIMRKPYRVADLRKERGKVWTLILEPQGHAGLHFLPGQFAWLSLWYKPLPSANILFQSHQARNILKELKCQSRPWVTSQVGSGRLGWENRHILKVPTGFSA